MFRVCATPWSTRHQFVQAMLGYSASILLGSTRQLMRQIPNYHPAWPKKFYATSCDLVSAEGPHRNAVPADFPGINDYPAANSNQGSIYFDTAIYRVRYEQLPYAVKKDHQVQTAPTTWQEWERFTEKIIKIEGEALQLPGTGFKWVTAPNDLIPEPPAKIMPTMTITYKWHRVPTVPLTGMTTCFGKVNSAAFDGYPAGTLLYTGSEVEKFSALCGPSDYEYTISHSFMYRNNGDVGGGVYAGHNYLYRFSSRAFELVSSDGTGGGSKIYDSADVTQLFTLDS